MLSPALCRGGKDEDVENQVLKCWNGRSGTKKLLMKSCEFRGGLVDCAAGA